MCLSIPARHFALFAILPFVGARKCITGMVSHAFTGVDVLPEFDVAFSFLGFDPEKPGLMIVCDFHCRLSITGGGVELVDAKGCGVRECERSGFVDDVFAGLNKKLWLPEPTPLLEWSRRYLSALCELVLVQQRHCEHLLGSSTVE